MINYLVVGVGGFFGAIARYLVEGWIGKRMGAAFPYGTLAINVTGSFVLGLFVTLITERFIVHPHWRLLIAIGFLGAYTTFSTFGYETNRLVEEGSFWLALLNIFLSVAIGLLAVRLGIILGRQI
ncbi:MAG TPA: fluoride efflux transporter CrcB [Candidatus Manganitrophaceae bacterium]|nr:fluoride efflux transporter CrcB [Candidatus Manganitrophaceae bacterium]